MTAITIWLCIWVIHTVIAYHSVVNQLQQYVETNETFALLLNRSFIEAGRGPNSTYPIAYIDAYIFFDSWINIIGNYSNTTFYDQFYEFANTETGQNILLEQKAQSWLISYLIIKKNFADSCNSSSIISDWQSWNKINMTQYIVPSDGFHSFNAFFTRKIKPEFRPISSANDSSVVVSPVDGQINVIYSNLSINGIYRIKGVYYNLTQMLNSEYYAHLFEEGTAIQITLDAYNYHRYHSSVDGLITSINIISGYALVSPTSKQVEKEGYLQFFANHNVRGIVYLDTEFGVVAQMHVGMYLYSSINYDVSAGERIKKGDELGYFKYGGSTVLILFQNNVIRNFNINFVIMSSWDKILQ